MSGILPIDCDVLVEWEDPIDEADGTFIGVDATGAVTVTDADGIALTGAEDLAAEYVAGPPRRYRVTIPHTIVLVEGATYYIEFTLTAGDGSPVGKRRLPVVAAYGE